ncbi:MAG: TetR/AcrR family transcriptional regulator [Acidobacteriota bacterium]
MPITLGQHPASDSTPDGQDADEAPRRRDPKATRKALLDAAEELFSVQGPSATSLTQVAKKAGVTKSLIHHHFGSKEELWEEVQQRYFSEYFEAQKAMIESAESTASLLRDSLITYFRFLQAHPESVRFVTWTFATKDDDHCPTKHEEELFELGMKRIKEAQAKGEIRADLEPFFIIKTLIALPLAWFQTHKDTLALLDGALAPKALDELYLRDMVEIFLNGVRPPDVPNLSAAGTPAAGTPDADVSK